MIRFINLGDQIYCDEETNSFAFFDTVTSMFRMFNGSQYWDTAEDFIEDFNQECPIRVMPGQPKGKIALDLEEINNEFKRYKEKIPKKFFEGSFTPSDSPSQ